jgi:hypothetical protein
MNLAAGLNYVNFTLGYAFNTSPSRVLAAENTNWDLAKKIRKLFGREI